MTVSEIIKLATPITMVVFSPQVICRGLCNRLHPFKPKIRTYKALTIRQVTVHFHFKFVFSLILQ